jgi:hypothetical protein
LAIADASTFSAAASPLEASSFDRPPWKLVSMEVPADRNVPPAALGNSATANGGLDHDSKANSSLLKRLAERFGLPH